MLFSHFSSYFLKSITFEAFMRFASCGYRWKAFEKYYSKSERFWVRYNSDYDDTIVVKCIFPIFRVWDIFRESHISAQRIFPEGTLWPPDAYSCRLQTSSFFPKSTDAFSSFCLPSEKLRDEIFSLPTLIFRTQCPI